MNSKAFIAFLIVSGLVSLGIILFFAKRHPIPRFRPKRGEVVLLALIMGFASVGLSFFLSQLFEHDWDLNRTKRDPAKELSRPTGEGESGQNPGEGKESKASDDESLPPFLRESDE